MPSKEEVPIYPNNQEQRESLSDGEVNNPWQPLIDSLDKFSDDFMATREQPSLQIIPTVSDEEQEEINTEVGSPADFDETEFINLTEWTKYGGQL